MSKRMSVRFRLGAMLGAVAVGSLLLGACGPEYRAERQGKQFGEEICDLRDADSPDEAQRQLEQAQREMNDLQRIVGRPVEEDVDDIQENLEDLVQHVVDGDEALLDQDISVIQRNIAAVKRTLSGKGEAAYDGIQQALASCD
jgi:anion-transporting  ArsA/GET3 family ATPase